MIALDGKTARGARLAGGRAVHLLATFDTGTGEVLGQGVADGKTNEINPRLLAQPTALPWVQVPVTDHTADKRHGRVEERIVKLTAAAAGIAFPGAALAIRTTRRRKPLPGGKWRTETVHAITDPTHGQTRPAQLADAARAHWGIENRLHWVRDVTFDEDRSQIRTGHGPAVMATLRNLAISLHRTAGATARACRTVSRHPNRVLPLPT